VAIILVVDQWESYLHYGEFHIHTDQKGLIHFIGTLQPGTSAYRLQDKTSSSACTHALSRALQL
jgi:hypothetical protein